MNDFLSTEIATQLDHDSNSNARVSSIGLAGKASVKTFSHRCPEIQEQVLRTNQTWFEGELVFKARRLLYHSIPGRE